MSSYQIKASSTAYPLMFLMVSNADHRTGATGLSPTVVISKAGAAFGSPAGAVSEVGNGWYKVAGNATDSATLGPLALNAQASGADTTDEIYEVVAHDVQDAVHLGLSCLPNTAVTTNASLLTSGTGTDQLSVTSGRIDIGKALGTAITLDANNVINVSTKYLAGTSQTARDIGASVLLSTGTGTGQLDFTAGVVKANAVQWLGGTIPAVNVTGVPLVDAKYLLGTIFVTPATAGIIDVNLKNIANAAVSTSTAQLGVNAVNVGGTAQTGRDLGASVLLSTGTGAGQLDFTSGVVKANATQWLGGTIPAVNVTGVPLVDLKYTLGTISPATAGSVRADSVTGAVGSVTGNVGGNVTGSVGSVTGAVGSVTAAVTLSAGDSPVMQSGTATAGGASTITIQTALGADSLPVGCTIKITGGTGVDQARVITAYVNSTRVVTVDRAWTTNPDATSVYSILYTDLPALSAGLKITDVALVDTLTTYTGNTVQTGDSYARLGAPAGASIAADLAEIEGETDGIAAIPTTPLLAANVPANFSALAITAGGIVSADLQTIKTQTVTCAAGVTVNVNVGTTQPVNFTGTAGSALVKSDMVDVAGLAVATGSAQLGVNVVNIAGQAAALDANNRLKVDVDDWGGAAVFGAIPPDSTFVRSGTAQAGGASTITLDAGASATNNLYQNQVVAITSGTGAGQSALIASYVGSTKVATINGTWATNPDNTSKFVLHAFGAISASVSGNVTVGGYAGGQDPGTYVLATPANKLATDASGRVDLGKALGTAITLDANNVINVSAKYLGGTLLTARDIGSSVLLSAGTGAGQLDFTSGVVKANATQFAGQTITCGAGVTVLASVGTAATSTAQTGDSYARLGAPAGASIAADLAEIEGETDGIAGISTGVNVTSINSISTAAVTTVAANIGTDNPAATLAQVQAAIISDATPFAGADVAVVKGRLPAALSTNGNMKCDIEELAGNTGGASRLDRSARAIVTGTVGSASTTTSIVTSSLSPAAAVTGQFVGRIVIFDKDTTTANLRGQATDITASTSGGVLTVTALTTAPVSSDSFTIT